jgi:hypothetical protein
VKTLRTFSPELVVAFDELAHHDDPFRIAYGHSISIFPLPRDVSHEILGIQLPSEVREIMPLLVGIPSDFNEHGDGSWALKFMDEFRETVPETPLHWPEPASAECLEVLPERLRATVLYHMLPEFPAALNLAMHRFLITQPIWVCHFVLCRPRPSLLLPPGHYIVLYRAISKPRELMDEPDVDVNGVVCYYLEQSDILSALLAISNSRLRRIPVNGLIQELAFVSDNSMRLILEGVARHLSTCDMRLSGNLLGILRDLSVGPNFKALFLEIIVDSLIKIMGAPALVKSPFLQTACEILVQLHDDIPSSAVQLFVFLLISKIPKMQEQGLELSARLPASKRELVGPYVESAFMKVLEQENRLLSSILPSIIEGFPFLARNKRSCLLRLLSKSLENYSSDKLALIGVIFNLLIPQNSHGLTSGPPIDSIQVPIPSYIVDQAPEVWEIFTRHFALINSLISANPNLLDSEFKFLLNYPELLEMKQKAKYFQLKQISKVNNRIVVKNEVRRDHLLRDSYDRLHRMPADRLLGHFHVIFTDEVGIDAGGLTREWFQLLIHEIFDQNSGLFELSRNQRSFQPKPIISREQLDYFRFTGKIFACAMIPNIPIDAHLTSTFLKNLLEIPM